MNNTRTLYARNAFAAAAVALIGSVSALPATAQEASRSQIQASASKGSSILSRAEVRASAERAVASGAIEAQMGNSYGYQLPRTSSLQSRAEVREDTLRAIRSGQVNTVVGDSDGHGSPAKAL